MTTPTHYQVTDSESLCDTLTTEGVTAEGRVTCYACQSLLMRYRSDTDLCIEGIVMGGLYDPAHPAHVAALRWHPLSSDLRAVLEED